MDESAGVKAFTAVLRLAPLVRPESSKILLLAEGLSCMRNGQLSGKTVEVLAECLGLESS